MPEPDGLSLDDAVRTVRTIATSGAPVIAFGPTAAMARKDGDMDATANAVAVLAEAALGGPAA